MSVNASWTASAVLFGVESGPKSIEVNGYPPINLDVY